MIGFLSRRLLTLGLTLWLASLVVFVVLEVLPGDPALLMLGVSAAIFFLVNSIGNPIELMMAETPGMTGEVIDRMKAYYGLDHPPMTRYLLWLSRIVQLDFGTSIVYNQPADSLIVTWGWQTLKIQLPAILIALAIAILFGVTAARRQHTRSEFAVMATALLGQSLPAFFLGILLIFIFSYSLDWLPSYGAYSTRNPLWGSPTLEALWHMALPVAMRTYFTTATLTLTDGGIIYWLASPRDVRLARRRPKGTSLHVLSTRREVDAGPEIARRIGRCRPADSLNRYLLARPADER